MRKAIILPAVFVLALLTSLVVGVQIVKAQYTPDGQGFILVSPINIISPSNSTYTPQSLTLNLTVKSFLDSSKANITIVYSVDGKTNTTIRTESTPVPIGIQSYYLITGWATLPEMPEGSHSITVYGKYEFPGSYHNIGLDNRTVYFTVNDGNPPIISNLSLENKTYNQNNLPLNFTTDEPTSWIGYSLDGQTNTTIAGNTTLASLSSGMRNLTVYAEDAAGNIGASEIIDFRIELPFPTTWIIVGITSVAIASVGLLVYFKKRNH
ncbi:hypothetical protein MUO79_04330 [Candidatus Bathyarchaeota archaeon]|nr:hypothetical protein [Candidatus Bathyarchaeota archaeon]